MSRRAWWITGFLTVTAAAVTGELVAAFDHSPDTVPWTDLLGQYVPWPLTAIGVAVLVLWLPVHLYRRYRYPRKEITAMTLTPQTPTQTRHPWRATARTVVAGAVGVLSLVPIIATTAHVDTVPAVAQVVVVAGTVTRVLAVPAVDGWLRRYLPWLAASPSKPF